ncbi:NAD(P)/FAD-dependent oxidoreductase [Desmospora profundinema]|uniref:Sarcosine oxidase subunit alpha n=1 Tax=Desmospora profundinema TaxID=1571184 RepID=A0ABU1IJQ5_9BACL|nr:FAD-dependent oxidoreductase [Desmospora profundinema]MDR6224916.1 sarcosine oxidase subunit alpha [Desmospora profundinema]
MTVDVLIVGAGPAGLSAAIACVQHGLNVRVLDEFIKPGGRLLGQLHQEPDGTWWNGIEEARKLYETAQSLGIQVECGIPVVHLEPAEGKWLIHIPDAVIQASTVVLATGAAEKPLPVPGWTLPGVMSIGAAQVMTNVHRVRVGERGVVVGINILSAAIARELQLGGIHISGLYLPGLTPLTNHSGHPAWVMKSLLRLSHLAPSSLIRFGSRLLKADAMHALGIRLFPKSGVKMWGIPIHLRKAVLEIIGDQQVEKVKVATVTPEGDPLPGTEEEIAVDFVCIAGGLYPLAELAAIAGCPFHYFPELGGHVPVHSPRMETPQKGLYVAGNITGIESAKVAKAQGTVAGLSIVYHFQPNERSKELLEHAIQQVKQERDQAVIQFHPAIKQARTRIKHLWNHPHPDSTQSTPLP